MEIILLAVWSPAILYGLGKCAIALQKLGDVVTDTKRIDFSRE